MGGKNWSPEELALFKRFYCQMPKADLQKMLPHRTWHAILNHAQRVGLSGKRINLGHFKKGVKRSEESVRKQARTIQGDGNVSKRLDVRKKISKRLKELIRAGTFCPARHVHKKPSLPETRLIQIIEANNLPFIYVGDGSLIIRGLNPDFIESNGKKKIIEVFGRAFHDPSYKHAFKKKIPYYQLEGGRKSIYAQLGFDCLIIWDDELNDEGEIVKRINRFM